jgi:hypothetical protein
MGFTGHQKLGVVYKPQPCTQPLETSAFCVSGLGAPKTPTGELAWRAADPFVVYTWIPCTFVGEAPEELEADTLAAHENNVGTRVEENFWTGGDFGTSQRLAADTEVQIISGGNTIVLQTAATVVTGATVDVVEAFGLLEGAMARCYSGTPFLHVPRKALADLSASHLIVEGTYGSARRKVLRTKNGSVVIPYALEDSQILGPDGMAAPLGTAWFYATGALKIWRGELDMTAKNAKEALIKSVNGTVLIVEERFIVGWDCCHFAVNASLGGAVA